MLGCQFEGGDSHGFVCNPVDTCCLNSAANSRSHYKLAISELSVCFHCFMCFS